MNGVESPCPHSLSLCICLVAEENYATYWSEQLNSISCLSPCVLAITSSINLPARLQLRSSVLLRQALVDTGAFYIAKIKSSVH